MKSLLLIFYFVIKNQYQKKTHILSYVLLLKTLVKLITFSEHINYKGETSFYSEKALKILEGFWVLHPYSANPFLAPLA